MSNNLITNWAKSTLKQLSSLPENEKVRVAFQVLLEELMETSRRNSELERVIAAQNATIDRLTAEVEAGNRFMDDVFRNF